MAARFSDFYAFIQEREEIRLRKEAGLFTLEQGDAPQGPPWTDDPILSRYKFTNVFRHYDRTSMELRNRFYTPHFESDHKEILMNCALFRYFGTWEFATAIGWQSYDHFDFDGIKDLAKSRLQNKERVFTGAYVITNQGISAPKQEVVVDYFLQDLHTAAPEIVDIALETHSWRMVGSRMKTIKGFGGSGFMTKEVLLDTTYTGFWNHRFGTEKDGWFSVPDDWWEWTPIGPGARRGASRVLGDDSARPVSEPKAFDLIMGLCEAQDRYWEFSKLAPTDIQFQLCEFDKYERVRLGQGKPRSIYRP